MVFIVGLGVKGHERVTILSFARGARVIKLVVDLVVKGKSSPN